jgi:hypothetical protein
MELFSEEEFENHLHTQCGVWAVAPDKFHFYSDVNRATQKQVTETQVAPVDSFEGRNSWICFRFVNRRTEGSNAEGRHRCGCVIAILPGIVNQAKECVVLNARSPLYPA